MKRRRKQGSHRSPTNEEIHAAMHEEALETDGVIELGVTTREQGALFERLRTGISHGHMLKTTFDEAVKKRCKINYEGTEMPKAVDPEVFDADVLRLQNMTDTEADSFDDEVCHARMERRAEGGGIFVSRERGAGFGRDVFGFAYDLRSGKWCATNEMGLHAHCEDHLRMQIREEDEQANTEIVSGFVFQLSFIRTPIMTPFGYMWNSPQLMKKGFEELWTWKRFIPIDCIEVAPTKHRWGQLFTPEYAETVCQQSQ